MICSDGYAKGEPIFTATSQEFAYGDNIYNTVEKFGVSKIFFFNTFFLSQGDYKERENHGSICKQ